MSQHYYIKMPVKSNENHHVAVSNFATYMTSTFPPEYACLFVEVTDEKGVTERLKGFIDNMVNGDQLSVPAANMLTTDVEGFFELERQLEAKDIALIVYGN
jgi:hypothetical protein